MPTIKIYSKEQVDALIASAGGLPDPTSASAGDVLTLDANKDPAWVAPSGGNSDWEDVDLSQPFNFTDKDEIEFELKFDASISYSASWESSVPSTVSGVDLSGTTKTWATIFHFSIVDDINNHYAYHFMPLSITTNYILAMSCELNTRKAFWNTETNTIGLRIELFNGKGCKFGTTNVTLSSLKSSITWMRVKHHA